MFARALRHIFTTRGSVRRAFPAPALERIELAVRESESRHDGEIRVAIEAELVWPALFAGQTAQERALEVFALSRTWDTERNNGVLIYLLFADRDVGVVADRAFNGRVADDEWGKICAAMRRRFAAGEFETGMLEAVAAVSTLIAAHFPAGTGVRRDELPDRPVIL